MGKGGGVVGMQWWWWRGGRFDHTGGSGIVRRKSKLSRWGSVSGAPSEIVWETMGKGGGWCVCDGGGAGSWAQLCGQQRRVLQKKPESDPLGFDFVHTIQNGGGDRWDEVLAWCL